MRLRTQVVQLVRPNRFHQLIERRPVGQIRIHKSQPYILLVRILVNVIDPPRVERRRAPHNAVNFVSLGQQQFGQIRSILTGDSGHQRPLAISSWIGHLLLQLNGLASCEIERLCASRQSTGTLFEETSYRFAPIPPEAKSLVASPSNAAANSLSASAAFRPVGSYPFESHP